MVDYYYSETDVGFVPCQHCKPIVDELLAACKKYLQFYCDSDMQPEDECSDLYYLMAAAVAKVEGQP